MAIKAIDFNKEFVREVKRTVSDGTNTKTVTDLYYQTAFVADTASDISAMNAAGSEYLNYPAGSAVICCENKKRYVLNGSETAYAEV